MRDGYLRGSVPQPATRAPDGGFTGVPDRTIYRGTIYRERAHPRRRQAPQLT